MEVQTQVGGRLRADIGRLHEVLNTTALQGIASVGRIAERVCEAFDLRDGRGRLQRASCRQALRALEAGGHVSLPAPRRRGGAGRVDEAKAQQQSRPGYKPAPDHPWRRPFKPGTAAMAPG